MVQRIADWIKRAICLILEGASDCMIEDGEEKEENKREIWEDKLQRLEAKGQE